MKSPLEMSKLVCAQSNIRFEIAEIEEHSGGKINKIYLDFREFCWLIS